MIFRAVEDNYEIFVVLEPFAHWDDIFMAIERGQEVNFEGHNTAINFRPFRDLN